MKMIEHFLANLRPNRPAPEEPVEEKVAQSEPPPEKFSWAKAASRLRLESATPSNVRSAAGLFTTRRGEAAMVDRFGEVLPYADFDKTSNLFLLDSGEPGKYEGLGYVLEVSPQIGADEQLMNGMLDIVAANSPPKTGIQISLLGSPRIDYFVRRMVDVTVDPRSKRGQIFPEQYAVLRRLFEQRAQFFKRGAIDGTAAHSNHRLRDFRGFFSVVYPTSNPTDPKVIRDVLLLRETHISTLRQYFLYAYTWGVEDLMWWTALTLNPHRVLRGDSPVLHYDEFVEPRFQCVAPDTCIDIEQNRIDFYSQPDKSDAMSAVCMSVRSFPQSINLQSMSDLLGSMSNSAITYPCPYVITMGFQVPDYEAVKNKTLMKSAAAERQAGLDIARFMPDLKDVNSDWKIAQQSFTEGKGTVRMYLQLCLYATPDDASKVGEIARSVWRTANFELANDLKMQQQALLSTLPMLNGPLLSNDLVKARRSTTKTSWNAANMFPVVAEWPGTPPRDREREPTPLLPFIGRRGQVMSIDPYANPAGNPNMVICGASGSGKSFLANTLVTSVLATGGRVWIIDVGFTYKKLCETLGGQYLEFDDKTDLCINPFDFVHDLEKDMPFIKGVVALMCSMNEPLSPYELSQLEVHIQSVWLDGQLRGFVPTITDLAESLKNNCMLGGPNPHGEQMDDERREEIRSMSAEERSKLCDPRIRDLGVQLYPFTLDGAYGRFFNRATNVRFNSNLIVLELEQLKANKHLQSVILLMLMNLISHEVYQGDPGIKKLVLLDEAWALLKKGQEATADFIEEMYRRVRTKGGACCTCTQSIGDYTTSVSAQAALTNADCIFLLRQKKDSIAALIESKKLVLSEHDLALLRSVTKKDGEFSEAFIKIGDFNGVVGRLIMDPFSALLYSSSPVDKAAINEYRGRGLSLADSLGAVLRDRGVKDVQALQLEALDEEMA